MVFDFRSVCTSGSVVSYGVFGIEITTNNDLLIWMMWSKSVFIILILRRTYAAPIMSRDVILNFIFMVSMFGRIGCGVSSDVFVDCYWYASFLFVVVVGIPSFLYILQFLSLILSEGVS